MISPFNYEIHANVAALTINIPSFIAYSLGFSAAQVLVKAFSLNKSGQGISTLNPFHSFSLYCGTVTVPSTAALKTVYLALTSHEVTMAGDVSMMIPPSM